MHGPATLNGGRFDEAALAAGDRLRIGPVELELIECSQAAPAPAPSAVPVGPPSIEPSSFETVKLKSKLEDAEDHVARLEGESRQAFESSMLAAERANQLRDALAVAHEQLAGTCDELDAAREACARQSDQLTACQQELNDCQKQLAALRDSEATKSTLEEQVRANAAAAEQQCAAVQAELAELRTSAEKERSCWDDAKLQLERRLAQRDAEIEEQCTALQTELADVRTTAEKDRSCWDEAKLQLERRLAQRDAEIEALRSAPAVQAGAMTVAVDERPAFDNGIQVELEAKLAGLEQRLSAKQSEVESLQNLVDQHATVQHRLERLAQENDTKCRELEEALQAAADAQSNVESLQILVDQHAAVQLRLETLAQEYDAKCRELEDARQAAADAENNSAGANELEERTQALTRWQEELAKREAANVDAQQQLTQDRDQLTAGQEQLGVTRQQVEEQLAAATARLNELGELHERLVDERAALNQRDEQQDQRRQELETHSQEIEAQAESLKARAAELEANRNELDAQVAALAVRSASQSDNAMPTAAPSEIADEAIETPQQEDDAVLVDDAVPMDEAAIAPQQTALKAPENPSESASVSSVLSRLVKAGLWRGEESPETAEAGNEPENKADARRPAETDDVAAEAPVMQESDSLPTRPQPAAEGGHEEESIESYMERLMKRVRGDSSVSDSSPAPRPMPVSRPAPQAESAPIAAIAPLPATAVPQPATLEPSEFSPRRTAPELDTDLTAMRALANSAARSAIDRHVRQHTGKQATGKLFGACFTVVASLVLSYWAWKAHSLQAATGAAIGGAVGAYWTLAACRRLSSLMRLNKLHQESTDAKKASEG